MVYGCDEFHQDLQTVEWVAKHLGIQVNKEKSEGDCCNPITLAACLSAVPGIKFNSPEHVSLLGSPLSDLIPFLRK